MTLFIPSWGIRSPRMDADTPHLGQARDPHYTLKKEVVSFGGTLAWLDDELPPSPTRKLAFGGLGVTYIVLDAMKEDRV
jgi:hypothetical protein